MTPARELLVFLAHFLLGGATGALLPLAYTVKNAVLANLAALLIVCVWWGGFWQLTVATAGGVLSAFSIVAAVIGAGVFLRLVCDHLRSKTLLSRFVKAERFADAERHGKHPGKSEKTS